MFNYLFELPSTAFVIISCLNIFIGICSTIGTVILDQLTITKSSSLTNTNNILKPIFTILFPHYCLGRGVIDLLVQYQIKQIKSIYGIKSDYSALDFDVIGKNIIALFVQGVVFFIINLLIEYKFFIRPSTKKDINRSDDDIEDDDVKAERLRILSLENLKNKKDVRNDDSKDFVKLVNISKTYSKIKKFKKTKHLAVQSSCLGINKGECFGLIGN